MPSPLTVCLAFDTATEHLSIALQVGDRTWSHEAAGGALASSTLIPGVMDLLAQASVGLRELDAIAFGRGPGAFTGLRTACSVAQGLAFGANLPVLPIDTLMAVAEEARHQHGVLKVQALLDARMDEVYTGFYSHQDGHWTQRDDFQLIRPDNLHQDPGWAQAGNAFAVYGERIPPSDGIRITTLPTATAMLRLAPALLAAGGAVHADQALPRYIRDKVAKTTDERMAEKAALAATLQP